VRVERRGEVWVFTGDYKTQPDPTCEPFELVPCHTFITEATFGLPFIAGPTRLRFLSKSTTGGAPTRRKCHQRDLRLFAWKGAAHPGRQSRPAMGPIYTHGAVERLNHAYRQIGIDLPPTPRATQVERPQWDKALIIAPPSARATPWTRRFGTQSSGFASGWMRVRGARRRRAVDRGFVLSDHVDWPALLEVISQTGASRVYATHGYTHVLARWLQEQGLEAHPLETPLQSRTGRGGGKKRIMGDGSMRTRELWTD
jgi:putative mRNA 3-end processing factor